MEENNKSLFNNTNSDFRTSNLTQKTVSGIVWKLAERIGAQLVTLIVSIVLARILLPDDYGVVSVVTIIITLLNVFVTHGLGSSLIQKKTSDQLDFSTIFFSSIFISLILYGILFFVSTPIADFYGNHQITWVLRIMGLRLPFAAINSVQQAYVSKKMLFKKFFFSTLIGTIVSGIVGIIMAYQGFGLWALVAQYLINVIIDTVVLFIIVKWRPSFMFSFDRFKKLFSFGWKLLVSGLIDAGYDELRSFVIGKKYSPTDLAYYEKGRQFPSVISTNVNASISSVLFSAMAIVQDDKNKIREVTRKSIKICSYLIFPCMMGLACVADNFVRVVLTDKWLAIVPYIQIMCFVYAFWPVHTANLSALKALGRSDIYLVLEVIKKTIGITVLLISMWFGVFWIVFCSIFITIISSCINAFPNKKLFNYSYGQQLIDLMPNIALCVLMGIPVYFMKYINLNIYLLLLLQIITGVIIYIFLSFVTKNYSFFYLFNFVKDLHLKRKKYKNTLNYYLFKHKKQLNNNISLEELNRYSYLYCEDNIKTILIGEIKDDTFVIKYFRIKKNREKWLIQKKVSDFLIENNIVKITNESDKKSTYLLFKCKLLKNTEL